MRIVLIAAVSLAFLPSVFADVQTPKSGIHYGTLTSNQGPLRRIWGHGTGSARQFLQDVNGDGMDDAVVWFDVSGDWYVALSDGVLFQPYSQWATGLGSSTDHVLMGDLDGDGNDDICLFDTTTGHVRVALSSGTSFSAPSTWATPGIAGDNVMLGDVDGDGMNDVVVFNDADGTWNVGISDATGFSTFSAWTAGHGSGSQDQLLGDVDNDGRADAVVFFGEGTGLDGNWYVAPSTGSAFGGYSQWASGVGASSRKRFLYDVNGNGTADAIYYDNGTWAVAHSNSSSFISPVWWVTGLREHPNRFASPEELLLGSIDGTEPYATVYYKGSWFCMTNPDYFGPALSAAEVNFWELDYADVYDTDYVLNGHVPLEPVVNGEVNLYDGLDIEVVDTHIQMLHDAGFDYLTLDLSNGAGTQWVKKRADVVAERLRAWNNNLPDGGHEMFFAILVGWNLRAGNGPESFESEAAYIWQEYGLAYPDCYYLLNGKPLLINFVVDQANADEWINWTGDKSTTDNFTVRWMVHEVNETHENMHYYGWPFRGNPYDDEVMGVMPGWNNFVGHTPVERNGGEFYRNQWCRVLEYGPGSVYVNSFTDFGEVTAVHPVHSEDPYWQPTDLLGNPMDDFYWVMTEQYNRLFKYNQLKAGTYFQERGDDAIYSVEDGGFEYASTMPTQAPVLLVPVGFIEAFDGTIVGEPGTVPEVPVTGLFAHVLLLALLAGIGCMAHRKAAN